MIPRRRRQQQKWLIGSVGARCVAAISSGGNEQLRKKRERRSCFRALRLERVVCTDVQMKTRLIVSDPEILGGTPVFAGTRVPVKNLTDCLESGDSIDDFLDDFPSVSRAQVIEFLEEACAQLTANCA
jgi:uncharacterized protein (DUF433 family)